MLKKNDDCPHFSGLDQDGNRISFEDYRGKPVILYFYPKDNTPGCTLESCGFRDVYQEVQSLGGDLIGISKDSVKSHKKFVEKYNLPFRLLADEDKSVCQSFGVLAEKSMFGKKYVGIERATFLIDKAGKIAHVWPKVKIMGHVSEVMGEFKKLCAQTVTLEAK